MDHVSALLLELGLLFLGLSVLGLVARRLGLSPIPFVLVAALALGDGGVVPLTTAEPFLTAAAEIGVVLLLLTLGLEFSAGELFGSFRGTPSGVDLMLNAPPGFVAGLLLGLPWEGALALAGVTWVSSSGIVARLLGDLGRLANRETPRRAVGARPRGPRDGPLPPAAGGGLAGEGRCRRPPAWRWPSARSLPCCSPPSGTATGWGRLPTTTTSRSCSGWWD